LLLATETPHKAEGKDIALNSLNHALEKYQIIIDPNLVRRVFAEAFPSFATASARRLRDKIMHLFHRLQSTKLERVAISYSLTWIV
jgi:hypothetical protein